MNVIDALKRDQLKDGVPQFRPGDTVKVFSKVTEGGKERTQMFEGVVIVRKGGSSAESITVRRIAHGVGVEKTFLLHSPRVERIEVGKRGIVLLPDAEPVGVRRGRHTQRGAGPSCAPSPSSASVRARRAARREEPMPVRHCSLKTV